MPGIGVFRLVRSCAEVGDTVLSAPSTRVVFEPLADAEADALVASVCRREGMVYYDEKERCNAKETVCRG